MAIEFDFAQRATMIGIVLGLLLCHFGLQEDDTSYARQTAQVDHPATWHVCRLHRVIDGDTIDVLPVDGDADATPARIRLAEIDAPERGQAGYEAAKKTVDSFCGRTTLYIHITGYDRKYGREVGIVYSQKDRGSLNALLVASGHAWWYGDYSQSEWLKAIEHEARTQKIGIWADADPQPPWDWRRKKRRPRTASDR